MQVDFSERSLSIEQKLASKKILRISGEFGLNETVAVELCQVIRKMSPQFLFTAASTSTAQVNKTCTDAALATSLL